jgi:hypothetical protein
LTAFDECLQDPRHISTNSASLNKVKIAELFGCGIYSMPRQNDVLLETRVTSVHTLQLQSQFHILPLTEEWHCAESVHRTVERKKLCKLMVFWKTG